MVNGSVGDRSIGQSISRLVGSVGLPIGHSLGPPFIGASIIIFPYKQHLAD